MPAEALGFGKISPRERLTALVAVSVVQLGLALALLIGFRVQLSRPADVVERLIEVALPKVPPPPVPIPQPQARPKAARQPSSAPKAEPDRIGGSPGPQPARTLPTVSPVVAVRPSAPPSGGGSGAGPALGSGAGGGTGGSGYGASGDGEGGTDLEQIAGEILPSDYPRGLRENGIGGRVEFVFTVGPNGRVTRCAVTRSSGVPELDALTCRLVQQRFRYRPSTDRFGRPIADEVEGEHIWVAAGRGGY
jgi:protein TonB